MLYYFSWLLKNYSQKKSTKNILKTSTFITQIVLQDSLKLFSQNPAYVSDDPWEKNFKIHGYSLDGSSKNILKNPRLYVRWSMNIYLQKPFKTRMVLGKISLNIQVMVVQGVKNILNKSRFICNRVLDNSL